MSDAPYIVFLLNGESLRVPVGTSVAAALAFCSAGAARLSVTGQARAPFCGMGICQECRLLVDGRRRLACQTLCTEGMRVETEDANDGMPSTKAES